MTVPVYKYKRQNKIFFYVKLSINGVQYCKRGFASKKEAIIYEASLLQDSHKKAIKHFIVKDVIGIYENDLKKRVKITTFVQNRNVLRNHIYPYFENIVIDKISTITLQMFYNQTLNNKTYRDKKKIFMIARDFLNFLKDYGLNDDVNINKLKEPYNSSARITNYNYYTREEFEKFLSASYSKRYTLIFLLLFNYGLRIGELLALKHSDFKKDKLLVRASITSKTGIGHQLEISTKNASSTRTYPMLESIRIAYGEYIKSYEYHPSNYVFSNGKSLTIGETPIRSMQKRMEQISGVKHIKLHEFRHSCATELINYGFTPEQVAAWLGHKSSVTTLNTYFHLFPSKKQEIANYYNNISNTKNVK